MKLLRKIVIRLVLIVCILILANYIYSHYFYKNDLCVHSQLSLKIASLQDSCEILYLGESSNFTVHGADLDKRSISEFASAYYPKIKLKAVNQEAAHAGIYKEILKHISPHSSIKTVVITCNLRSFGPDWIYSELESGLATKVALLNGGKSALYNRFMLSFNNSADDQKITRKLLRRLAWYKSYSKPYLPANNLKEWREQVLKSFDDQQVGILARTYVNSYGFEIDEKNPRVKDFDEIVKIAKSRDWNVVLNLMAENTQKAKELVGQALPKLMEENAAFLINRYQSKSLSIANNLNLIENDQYIDQGWTTEHYAEKGRKAIAMNLAETLKQYYENEYSHVKYKSVKKQCQFFHDCEMDKTWGQMASLTNEKAYSGNHSSVCWKEQPYSITFERPFNSIADSCKSYVNIRFQLYATELPDDCMLVFQLSENVELYWKTAVLNQISKAENYWQEIVQRFPIPEEKLAAQIVKVFVYNPNGSRVYIDDLKVEFE